MEERNLYTSLKLIDGSYENIKITTPEDLQWAAMYLPDQNQNLAV
ncbi:hypothetical protein DSL64_26380 [Dyadobacter luteus]|uniref:2-C-methyl-D-erythritol 4-phosphate cytidylyltransferase n=1 Tax=Dyadobacter luteus TaxID=2259619 RepID=A0A3D8Y6P6_9BACT|nr:hypothetical protein DSL64_26380 [Dyadobacter luteus]